MVDIRDHNIQVLHRLKQGDRDAFTELYNFYREDIFHFILKMTKSNTFAEDLLQSVFLKVWEKREEINTNLHFGAFLKKITLHQVLNFLRKAALDDALQKKIIAGMDKSSPSDAEEKLREKDLNQLYSKAISQLPVQKKTVYTLSREEHLTYDEIATRMHLSRNTVRNHMIEALRMIRAHISGNKKFYSN